ncbi:MAG TPA: pilus assembly protein TadG-related protein [Hyphomicrobiales bacterium]|nr:pilus assembly protein TadG-related protein [Hyphomicrobiales bacterium]
MVSSFRSNQQGAVAVIFALALVPMIIFMGVAVDYTRASDARTKMQAAIDATALAAARLPASESADDVSTKARSFFDGNLGLSDAMVVDSFSATRDTSSGVVTVSANGHLKTSLLGAVDVSSIEFGATTTAQSGSKNLEVVMALDNTGSMNDNGKIGALRDAATELVDDLSKNVTGADQLKIGMVPFATDVKVDPTDTTYSQADWIDFSNTDTSKTTCTTSGGGGGHWGDLRGAHAASFDLASFRPGDLDLAWGGGGGSWGGGGGGSGGTQTCTTTTTRSWTGCIQDRASPNNTTDAAVTGTSTKYPAISTCGSGENLTVVQPMTTDFDSLKTQISSMTAGGNTNVTIGAIWGLALLSQQAPFTEGVAYGGSETEKFLVILTDGANTADRYSSCGSGKSVNVSCLTTMNNRTLAACKAAKDVGVTVYTIGVMLDTTQVDGAAADAMLASCATDASHYLSVSDASELVPTFLGIAKSIENLRLTN